MTRPTTAQLNAAYDQFNFWYDRAKKLDEELAKAEKRIAELESRTVKLPERYACELGYNAPDPNGDMHDRDDVLAMLTAAGIKWEAE